MATRPSTRNAGTLSGRASPRPWRAISGRAILQRGLCTESTAPGSSWLARSRARRATPRRARRASPRWTDRRRERPPPRLGPEEAARQLRLKSVPVPPADGDPRPVGAARVAAGVAFVGDVEANGLGLDQVLRIGEIDGDAVKKRGRARGEEIAVHPVLARGEDAVALDHRAEQRVPGRAPYRVVALPGQTDGAAGVERREKNVRPRSGEDRPQRIRRHAHVGLGGRRTAAVSDVKAPKHAHKPAFRGERGGSLDGKGEARNGSNGDHRDGARRAHDDVNQRANAVRIDLPGVFADIIARDPRSQGLVKRLMILISAYRLKKFITGKRNFRLSKT